MPFLLAKPTGTTYSPRFSTVLGDPVRFQHRPVELSAVLEVCERSRYGWCDRGRLNLRCWRCVSGPVRAATSRGLV